jgi:CRP-like cAMP-binding protein
MSHDLPKSRHSDLWQALHGLGPCAIDSGPKTLFRRGEVCRGIFMVEKGEVNLLLSPEPKSAHTFEIVGCGSVLGLAETMSGADYKLTAEASAGTRVTHLDRQYLLDRLYKDQHLCLQIVQLLSEDLHSLYHRFRALSPLGRTASRPRTTH